MSSISLLFHWCSVWSYNIFLLNEHNVIPISHVAMKKEVKEMNLQSKQCPLSSVKIHYWDLNENQKAQMLCYDLPKRKCFVTLRLIPQIYPLNNVFTIWWFILMLLYMLDASHISCCYSLTSTKASDLLNAIWKHPLANCEIH